MIASFDVIDSAPIWRTSFFRLTLGFERFGAPAHIRYSVFGFPTPGLFQAIGCMQIARVNIPVGILIWVLIIPMQAKIDFDALHQVTVP